MFLRPSQRDLGMTPGGRGQGCLVGAWSRTHYSKGCALRGQLYRTTMCCEKPPVLKMTAWVTVRGEGKGAGLALARQLWLSRAGATQGQPGPAELGPRPQSLGKEPAVDGP